MRRLGLCLVVGFVLAGCGGSSTALRRVSFPYKAATIELPSNWKFRDASYPSDHATWYWYDPHDPFAKLRVVFSGCVGCVSTNSGTPDPRAELPQYATVTAAPNQNTVSYTVFDTPYPDSGMVVVTEDRGHVAGSLVLDLWLPQKDSAEAAEILASLRTSGTG